MNHFNPHSENPAKNDRNVISKPSIRVVGKSGLFDMSLCPTFSPVVVVSNNNSGVVTSSIAGFDKQAWMLRKIITVGRRIKIS